MTMMMKCLIWHPWVWESMHFGLDGGVNDRDDTVDLAVDGDIDGEYTEALKRMESPTLDLHHVPLQPTKRKPLKQQKYTPPPPPHSSFLGCYRRIFRL